MKLRIMHACLFQDDIWAITMEDASLYKLSKEGESLEYIVQLGKENTAGAYSRVCVYEDSLLFIPAHVKYLTRYYVNSGKVEHYDLPIAGYNQREILFAGWYIVGKKVILFGFCFCGIIAIDLESGHVDIIDDYISETTLFSKRADQLGASVLVGNAVSQVSQVGDLLYVPFYNIGAVLEFNVNTYNTRVLALNSRFKGFSYIAYDGKKFWLAATGMSQGNIITWQLEDKVVDYLEASQEVSDAENDSYCSMIMHEDRIIVLADTGGKNYEIDIKTGRMKSISAIYEERESNVNYKYRFFKICENYIMYENKDVWGLFNLDTYAKKQYSYKMSPSAICHLIKQRMNDDCVIFEKHSLNLEVFLSGINCF